MRLSLAMITRGESTLAAAVASARPHVDEIVIVGTTPDAEAIAGPLADVYETFLGANGPDGIEDFALARQRSFDLATGDACLWVDADDRLVNGDRLRELAATMPAGTAFVELPYIYQSDERGRPTCVQTRERLVKPIGAWRWRDPVHEVLVTDERPVTRGETDAVSIVHERKGPPDYERNLRILRRWLEREPDSTRARFYLAMGYFDAGRFDESADAFRAFLSHGETHPDERAMAWMRLSWIAARKHDATGAIEAASEALRERPWAECSFALARAWHARAIETDDRSDYERVAFYAHAGLAAPLTKTPLWVNPLDRAAYIHATLNGVLAALGDYRGALSSVRAALEHLPGDAALRSNELRYEAELARAGSQAAADEVARVAAKAVRMHKDKTISLDVREVVGSVVGVEMPRPNGSLDIVFACGDAWEEWNPATIERRGIGGSEQAVAHMSRELAARGHRVRVFTSVGRGAGHYEGVEWLPSDQLTRATSCDVLVAWREMRFLEMVPAKIRLAWAHDTVLNGMSEWHAALADRVLALSEWHRECLLQQHPELTPEQITVTRNGIDLEAFAACDGLPRNEHVAIFSSSPTRGLPILLDWWPRVRELVPDAELRVFYGMGTWRAMAQANGDEKAIARIDVLEARLKAGHNDGVRFMGRVPPAQLAEEMSRAGVWLLPSWDTVNGEFWEVSCIGAMEAQAAGCRVIATELGALPETVGKAGLLIDTEPTTEEAAAQWIRSIAIAMTDGLLVEAWADRKAMAAAARERFAWGPVAEQWETLMRELLRSGAMEAA